MSHTLIMPKQTGKLDAFYASLQLYYNSYKKGEEWYSNKLFKQDIQKLLPYLSRGAQDGPYLVKQSELTRYFGLVFYDYTTQTGRGHITDRGIRFYNAYLQNNKNLQLDIIMESILNDSFGKNNTAIKSSFSDIDPPKLFLKSILDLNGITRKDLAYLLYVTHDKQISYHDALNEFRSADQDREINIPILVSNKYSDVKFTVLLTEIGICDSIDGQIYTLSEYTKLKFKEQINKLSIYNSTPEIVYTLREELDESLKDNIEDEVLNDPAQTQIITSFAYDINSRKFKDQNNRIPISYKTKYGVRYKTNPRIAKTALQLAKFKCEFSIDHITFISKLGHQYMEAHHLIPMHAQNDFSVNIDRVENIVSICPICHTGIHLGNTAVRIEYLKKLYDEKISELKSVGLNISFGELFAKYYK